MKKFKLPKHDPSTKFPILQSFSYVKGTTSKNKLSRFLRYLEKVNVEIDLLDILMDSGAFSTYTKGIKIDLDLYIDFCHTWKRYLFGYVALDVIKEPKATIANFKEMRRQGLTPIPVHTLGNTREDLEFMFECSDLVMFGGIAGSAMKEEKKRQLLKRNHEWAKGLGETHWLGYRDEGMIQALHPYSVDSTSWVAATKFGMLRAYLGRGRWEYLTRKDVCEGEGEVPKMIQKIGETVGISLEDFKTDARWRCDATRSFRDDLSCNINCYSWVQYVKEFLEVFKTRIFLAGVGFAPNARDQALYFWIKQMMEN